jgi:hypothetical protein
MPVTLTIIDLCLWLVYLLYVYRYIPIPFFVIFVLFSNWPKYNLSMFCCSPTDKPFIITVLLQECVFFKFSALMFEALAFSHLLMPVTLTLLDYPYLLCLWLVYLLYVYGYIPIHFIIFVLFSSLLKFNAYSGRQ